MSIIYRDKRGWLYMARATLNPNIFSEFYRKPDKQSWHRRAAANFCMTLEAAEKCMEEYAIKHNMEEVGWYRGTKGVNILLTDKGLKTVKQYIHDAKVKREQILEAGLDTAEDTNLITVSDICSDIHEESVKDYGEGMEYCNGWVITDNYDTDYCINLKPNEDFVIF